jgi:hypothetical protein
VPLRQAIALECEAICAHFVNVENRDLLGLPMSLRALRVNACAPHASDVMLLRPAVLA